MRVAPRELCCQLDNPVRVLLSDAVDAHRQLTDSIGGAPTRGHKKFSIKLPLLYIRLISLLSHSANLSLQSQPPPDVDIRHHHPPIWQPPHCVVISRR